MQSLFKLFARLLMVASLLSVGSTMAQSPPSMNDIYATAKAGDLEKAQVMVQQVLLSYPKSGKAYFVQAELYSRQGKLDRARESLSNAEKYAPGLPFAKAEAVQSLRAQLATNAVVKPLSGAASRYSAPSPVATSSSWFLPLLLTGGVIVALFFYFRKRNAGAADQHSLYANNQGLNGPQIFGAGGASAIQPAYALPGYQPGYPQQAAEPGMGSRIAGGVATGLAVGAGVMAAQAIGRNFLGDQARPNTEASSAGSKLYEPISYNTDVGGDTFGISDTSWESGGAELNSNEW